jgi:hypothetical protein
VAEPVSDGAEFQGRHFVQTAPVVLVSAAEERLALAFVTGGVCRFGRDLIADSMAPGAVDLSFVRSGRAPLLSEHCYTLDSLLGQVVAAEVTGPILRAMVRFARSPEADRLWCMLCDGFPLALSAGAMIQHAEVLEEHPDYRVIRASSWQLRELSVCVFGKDPATHMRRLSWDEDAVEIIAGMNERAGGAKRAAVEGALHLARWRKWSTATGVTMAADLGVPTDLLCNALDGHVARHCDSLLDDLAA